MEGSCDTEGVADGKIVSDGCCDTEGVRDGKLVTEGESEAEGEFEIVGVRSLSSVGPDGLDELDGNIDGEGVGSGDSDGPTDGRMEIGDDVNKIGAFDKVGSGDIVGLVVAVGFTVTVGAGDMDGSCVMTLQLVAPCSLEVAIS